MDTSKFGTFRHPASPAESTQAKAEPKPGQLVRWLSWVRPRLLEFTFLGVSAWALWSAVALERDRLARIHRDYADYDFLLLLGIALLAAYFIARWLRVQYGDRSAR